MWDSQFNRFDRRRHPRPNQPRNLLAGIAKNRVKTREPASTDSPSCRDAWRLLLGSALGKCQQRVGGHQISIAFHPTLMLVVYPRPVFLLQRANLLR